jgi:hypothetical protein
MVCELNSKKRFPQLNAAHIADPVPFPSHKAKLFSKARRVRNFFRCPALFCGCLTQKRSGTDEWFGW